jgi:hypothetical protein
MPMVVRAVGPNEIVRSMSLGPSVQRRLRIRLVIYAVAVLVVAVLGAVLIGSAEDASIGGGVLLGTIVLLGLPWSLVIFAVEDGLGGSIPAAIAFAAFAVANAVIVQAFAARRQGE